jgi:CRP/FNR family transcriptional regulator, nitrogen fixation regulation protein
MAVRHASPYAARFVVLRLGVMQKLGPSPTNGKHVGASLPTLGTLQRLALVTKYCVGETVYFQRQRSDHWYRMVSGAARECCLTADGRRQVVGFLLPGDAFGFSARATREVAGEIIADSLVESFPRGQAAALAESDPLVACKMREMAFNTIDRMQAHTLLLGCDSAREKVCAFLLEMSARSGAVPGNIISLPMSRYDIADYLGLAVETVSRTFTALRHQCIIALVGSRRVRVLDGDRLGRFGQAELSSAPAPGNPHELTRIKAHEAN